MYNINLFADRLKRFRKSKKRSDGKTYRQKDVADALGVTLDAVKSWEQARVWPSIDNLLKLSNLFKCDLDFFVGNIDEKTHDKQFIRDYTGLNDAAIESLAQLKKIVGPYGFDIPELLSVLLTYKGFITILVLFNDLRLFSGSLSKSKIDRWLFLTQTKDISLKDADKVIADTQAVLDRLGNIKYQIDHETNKMFNAFSTHKKTNRAIYGLVEEIKFAMLEKKKEVANGEHQAD